MAPTSGWYPDPSNPAQMRFWDGAKWTEATGPMPKPRQAEPTIPDLAMAAAPAGTWGAGAAQPFQLPPAAPAPVPSYGPAAGPGYGRSAPGLGLPLGPQRPSRLSSKARNAIAAGLTLALAAGVGIPLLLSSGKTALTKSFESKLLTASEISAITDETFAIDTSKDDNSADNSDSGCMAPVNNLITGKDRGQASQAFVSADHTTFVEEDLSNNTQNPSELALLQKTLQNCQSAPVDGVPAEISVVPSPAVAGSDDVLTFQVTMQENGTSLVLVFDFVRFGDNIVAVSAGGVDETAPMAALTHSLTRQAVSQARPAFK